MCRPLIFVVRDVHDRHSCLLRLGANQILHLTIKVAFSLGPLHGEALHRSNKSRSRTAPPSQSRAVHSASDCVEVPGDRRRNHAAGGTSTGCETIHPPKVGFRSCFLDLDEKKRVDEDRENVANGQVEVDGGVQNGLGDPDEEGHQEAGNRMQHGDDDEQPEYSDLLGSDREYDGLDEKGDSPINSH